MTLPRDMWLHLTTLCGWELAAVEGSRPRHAGVRPAAVASGKHGGYRPYLRPRITVFEVHGLDDTPGRTGVPQRECMFSVGDNNVT